MANQMESTKKVAIYTRVSTTDQTVENQLIDLRRYAGDRGWTVEEFCDHGVSGARESRPAFDRMLGEARKLRYSHLLVWKLDRLGRSAKHLVMTLDELRDLGIAFVSYTENLDSSTPLGRAVFGFLAILADLERSILVERIKAGLRRYRAEGRRLGRPPTANIDSKRVVELHRAGQSLRAIASAVGTSRTSVGRIIKSASVPKSSANLLT